MLPLSSSQKWLAIQIGKQYLCISDIPSPELQRRILRVKAVDALQIALPTTSDSTRISTTLVSTISSDGKIRLYDLASLPPSSSTSPNQEKVQIEPLTEYDTKGSRLTCLTLADGDVALPKSTSGKRKREEQKDEEAESDDDEEWGLEQEEPEDDDDEDEEEGEDENEDEEEYESA